MSRASERRGLGPFTTWIARADPAGAAWLQTSRRHRKGLPGLTVASTAVHPHEATRAVRNDWLRLWAPGRLGWWVAVAFMIGSAWFAIGGAQATWPDAPMLRWSDPGEVGWEFFIGSLFFTAAAYLQVVEALNNDLADTAGADAVSGRPWRFLGWRPHNLGFMASLVQLVGTVLFNLTTAAALIAGLGWEGEDLLVWTPDMTGSICFLVASEFAVMEFSHRTWSFCPTSVSWWIVAINLLGSILFQISAVASFVGPDSAMVSPWLASFGTFAGAVCFLIGAYLLIPELFEKPQMSRRPGRPGNEPQPRVYDGG